MSTHSHVLYLKIIVIPKDSTTGLQMSSRGHIQS